MRIVHVGHWDDDWNTEAEWRLAFEALGHQVVPLHDSITSWGTLRTEALDSDLLLWSGGCQPTQPLDHSLLTLWMLANRGIPSATLHLDPWWGLSRNDCPWWLNPMLQTGTVFTASGDDQDKWERWGKRHVWLPPAVRHTVVEQPGTPRDEWRCDVAFVGSNGRGYHPEWPYRRQLHNALVEMCRRNRWRFLNPGGDQSSISRSEMSDFYASAAVTVGDSLCPLKERSHYWSDRVSEATGRRGLIVMPEIAALGKLYPAMPTYPWGDWVQLEATIGHLLDEPDERAWSTAECHAVTAAHHTYLHRARTVLETLHLATPSATNAELSNR